MHLISEIGQRVAWLVGRPVLFFLRFRTEGKENIASLKNGFILASNHTSELDSLVILSSFSPFSKRLAIYFVSAPIETIVTVPDSAEISRLFDDKIMERSNL